MHYTRTEHMNESHPRPASARRTAPGTNPVAPAQHAVVRTTIAARSGTSAVVGPW